MSSYFLFKLASVTLVFVPRVYSFLSLIWSCQYFRNFYFLSFLSFLFCSKNSIILSWSRKEVFFLVGFVFLDLDFLKQDFFAVVPSISSFKIVEIELEGHRPLRQHIFKLWTMMLDFRPALAFVLTVFYTISSKLMDSQSCCFILTLIESLRLNGYSRL